MRVPVYGPVTITADDPRYESLVEGYNHRFVGQPDYVRLVRTTEQAVAAVQEAVTAGKRIAVRSGGHCFEDLTANPDVKVLLDMSQFNEVGYDTERAAFVVGAGAQLGPIYRTLYTGWGVTIPAGTCFEVGIGGHLIGGGYGPLSRRDGLVVDHLYAVEVVVVDESGTAKAVVATREPDDPHHDLWWAHAGGGGGNFGVATRFWLRSPGVTSDDPADQLPKPPKTMRKRFVMWSWEQLTEEKFTTLVRNYCDWYERNSAPDSPGRQLWSNLIITHKCSGMFGITSVIDADVPDSQEILDGQFAAMSEGLGVGYAMDVQEVVPWMSKWLPSYSWPSDPNGRYKNKAGYLRKGLSDRQIAVAYKHLTDDGYTNPMGCLILTGFGGQVNAVPSDATAVAQRDSILKASYSTGMWLTPDEDEKSLAWVQEYYRDIYADTGGVPVRDEINDGSYIGYPDVDLADPAWNTSGVPWSTLYHGHNYPRLQQVKRRYDPRDVFRHTLSVRLPEEPSDGGR
jgi:FAD binding domain-containing protein/berberine-like enzyme